MHVGRVDSTSWGHILARSDVGEPNTLSMVGKARLAWAAARISRGYGLGLLTCKHERARYLGAPMHPNGLRHELLDLLANKRP